MISSIAGGGADERQRTWAMRCPRDGRDVHGDDENARMITCDCSCTYRSSLRAGPRLRRRQRAIDRRTRRARRSTSTARRRSATRIAPSTTRSPYPHAIHYALKANSTLAIVRLLRSLGSRVDANSGGEIAVALRAGFAPEDIVFTGVGKTRDELEMRDRARASARSTPSRPASSIASPRSRAAQGRVARVALRVNPDIDAQSHPNISTGPQDATSSACRCRRPARSIASAARLPGLRFVGVHVHIGSQITTRGAAAPRRGRARLAGAGAARRRLHARARRSRRRARASRTKAGRSSRRRSTRPRSCPSCAARPAGGARAGTRGRRPFRRARRPRRRHQAAIPTAGSSRCSTPGMTELMRPALYGSFHRIVPVRPRAAPETAWDVVGPICESSDVFARDRMLPPLRRRRCSWRMLDTGAYGVGDGVELQPPPPGRRKCSSTRRSGR